MLTYGDWVFFEATALLLFALVATLAAVALFVAASIRGRMHCPTCDRRLARRSGQVSVYESRYYCPFHDPREETKTP